MNNTPETFADKQKSTRQRSPNYPVCTLEEAIKKISLWYKNDGVVTASRLAVLGHLGFEKETSDTDRLLSAMKSYGLVNEVDGKIKLTQRGIDIVARTEDDVKRIQALKDAALGPAIYAELVKDYPVETISDATLRSELIASKNFNHKYVDNFLKDFRATLKFAGILDACSVKSKDEGNNDEQPKSVREGDFVQWTSGGVDQFPIPRMVTGVSDDGQWVFLEGTGTGAAMSELTIVEAPPAEPKEKAGENLKPNPRIPPLNPNFTPTAVFKQDVFSLEEGDVSIKWPANMSEGSFEDLTAWLDILKRKIGRSVK